MSWGIAEVEVQVMWKYSKGIHVNIRGPRSPERPLGQHRGLTPPLSCSPHGAPAVLMWRYPLLFSVGDPQEAALPP